MKIEECEKAGLPFETVVDVVEHYIETQNTYFVLENLETLRKNGRLSNVKALCGVCPQNKTGHGSHRGGHDLPAGTGERNE